MNKKIIKTLILAIVITSLSSIIACVNKPELTKASGDSIGEYVGPGVYSTDSAKSYTTAELKNLFPGYNVVYYLRTGISSTFVAVSKNNNVMTYVRKGFRYEEWDTLLNVDGTPRIYEGEDVSSEFNVNIK